MDEDDIPLILKQYNSNFVTYELSPWIYTIKGNSEAVYTIGDHRGTLRIEYDDISMKTKLLLKRFGGTFGTLRSDKKLFSNTLLGVTPYWDFKPTNAFYAARPGIYNGNEILNLSILNEIHLKANVIDGSIVNGSRQPILYSFVFDKPAGYKVFSQPETIHSKKNKCVLNTTSFYLEDDNNKQVKFNGETTTFSMQMIKI